MVIETTDPPKPLPLTVARAISIGMKPFMARATCSVVTAHLHQKSFLLAEKAAKQVSIPDFDRSIFLCTLCIYSIDILTHTHKKKKRLEKAALPPKRLVSGYEPGFEQDPKKYCNKTPEPMGGARSSREARLDNICRLPTFSLPPQQQNWNPARDRLPHRSGDSNGA